MPESAMNASMQPTMQVKHDPAGRLAGHPHTIRSNGACREVSLFTGAAAASVLRGYAPIPPLPPPGVDEVVIARADFVPPGAVPPGIWTNGMTLRSAITRYGSRIALAYSCCICKQYLLYWHRWYFFKAAGPRSAGGGLPERKWMAAEASGVL